MNVHVLHHFFSFHPQIIFSAVFLFMFSGNPWITVDIFTQERHTSIFTEHGELHD